MESIKRTQKASASTHSATEVRLNRALEEIEKYKSQLQRAKLSSRVSLSHFLKELKVCLSTSVCYLKNSKKF